MKKLTLSIILALATILMLCVPVLAQSDTELPVPQPALYANDQIIQPDEYGNYTLNASGYCDIWAESGLEGSLTLAGNGIYNLVWDLDISGQITILDGSFTTNGYPITCGSFYVGYYRDSTPIEVNLGASSINCFAFAIRGSAVKLNADKSLITTTLLFDDTDKTGRVYNDVVIKSDNKIYGFIEGASKFNNLKFDNDVSVYLTSNIEVVKPEAIKGTVTSVDKAVKVIDSYVYEAAKVAVLEPEKEVIK